MNVHSFPIVKICNLCKEFSGVRVLDDINFDVNYGEIHGLVGENGAGKSTLAKIICGIHEPTLGEVYIENKKVNIFSTHIAMDLGIALIHQEPLIFPDLNVAENVLAISPNSPDALNLLFQEAMDKGIFVLVVNSDIPGSEEYRNVAVLPMDFEITGKSQVELMGSLIDYKGKIAILSATTDAPDQNYWIQGMKEALKNPKYEDMQLVEIAYGDDDPQKSLTEAEALLIKYPDLRGIIAPTTVAVAAAAQAVENAGRAPQLQVTGLGTPNQMRRFIKNGTVTAFALWSPYDEGYLSGYLAHGLVTGDIKVKEGEKFVVPELGEIEIGENRFIITGPPQIFDKDNIDKFNF